MLKKTLIRMSEDLPGCLAISVVNLDQGLPLLSIGDLDGIAGADAFHSNLYTLLHRGLGEMGADQSIKSVVIESKHSKFVSAQLAETGYFIHLICEKKTTLGFVHAVIRKYSRALIEELLALTTF